MDKLYRLESAGGAGNLGSVQVLPGREMAEAYDLPEIDTGKGRGFAWGYAGTGPAVTAASIVADLFGEHPTKDDFRDGRCRAAMHMQSVKQRFLAGLRSDVDVHVLSGDEIRQHCLTREEPCEVCAGTGEDLVERRCWACLGMTVQLRRAAEGV
jgi:hypothetical protein